MPVPFYAEIEVVKMNEITLLAKSGLGWQGIGGIILLLTGIGLIYFGIKALQGYRFFPEQEHNIPVSYTHLTLPTILRV
mgnify:CR=1 FL=1